MATLAQPAGAQTAGVGWVATWNPDLSAGPHRADFEPVLTRILNEAYATVTSTLDIRPTKDVAVHVYGRADYARPSSARAWVSATVPTTGAGGSTSTAGPASTPTSAP